ncbi:hypothetical protein DENSPDRAFT_564742 [Dentipellis sp. KUC8613]|nr:hypothetical protein DENSPDRAFT_564742 [Dentipellis sp. KUC8613]
MADSSTPNTSPQAAVSPDTKPRSAGTPFDSQRPGVDIILRSSDRVDFYMHKFVLSLASPIFESTFIIPQPQTADDGPPVVDLPEDSPTLESILRLCNPVPPPTFTRIADIRRVWEAALKYEMDGVRAGVLVFLDSFLDKDPLGVFALGCRANREDLCQAAATRLLHHSLRSIQSDELRYLSAYSYSKLAEWHARCCDAAAEVTTKRYWFASNGVLSLWEARCQCTNCWLPDHTPSQNRWYACQFVWDYLRRAQGILESSPRSAAITSEDVIGSSDIWYPCTCSSITCGTRYRHYEWERRTIPMILGQNVDRAVSEVRVAVKTISCV